jgi:hypothetical protein
MWNLITLDGFVEGAAPWDLDWHNEVWGDEPLEVSQAGQVANLRFQVRR